MAFIILFCIVSRLSHFARTTYHCSLLRATSMRSTYTDLNFVLRDYSDYHVQKNRKHLKASKPSA
ncbi:hypothetical protein GQ55_4G349900 [Panicum hallii var. hallii]|nr:hypothetical protein GQ55_4G349900 [Panicum hallii var. hallii]